MKQIIFLLFIATLMLGSCRQGGEAMTDTTDFASELQQKLDSANEGDVIELPDGKYTLSHPLLISGVKNITIRGKGKEVTVLTYSGQNAEQGAINISTKGVLLQSFTLNGKGASIKATNAKNVTLRDLKADLFRAIHSSNILLEDCDMSSSSGSAVCIELSQNIIIRKNHLQKSITGCRITNSVDADVYDNTIENNSMGIFINTVAVLSKRNTARCRIFNNKILNNNASNTTSDSASLNNASGIGLVILSAAQCDVYGNEIAGHSGTSIAILSTVSFRRSMDDTLPLYYSNGISLHDNKLTKGDGKPENASAVAQLFAKAFGDKLPDIIYDGVVNPAYRNPDGSVKEDRKICITNNNNNATFGNMDIPGKGANKSTDMKKYNCSLPPLHEVIVN